MKHYVKKFVKIFLITIVLFMLAVGVALGGAVFGYWGNIDDLDMESFTLNQNSVMLYNDPETGEEKILHTVNSSENREWVDIEEVPYYLQKAFISIEDERFMEHKGYDLPRTAKATFVWIWNKITGKSEVSLGGSTITQQLIKNVTGEKDQTPIRKIREISRAVALEKEYDKDSILELYLNCIYLSQGCNGVQTAARTYFGKDVSELTLTECAAIAGITQNPSAYDPITNPENNAARRKLVLDKMLELGHITQDEYDGAVNEDLLLHTGVEEEDEGSEVTSYFVDEVIREVLEGLQKQGYSEALATKMLYSGGIRINTTYNPYVQDAVEEYYEDADNFETVGIQSAITIVDVKTGGVVGIAGGIGEKTGSRILNRASESPRQPGSTIKPLAAYAPALEYGVITAGSVFIDEAKSYNGWTPRNYDHTYRGRVGVREAVRRSLNTTPVEIIDDMGAERSYDFLTENLGFTTLVKNRNVDAGILSDIGLSQLALGGLTDGMTTLEIAAAYGAFANDGVYNKPHAYTKVSDKDGNVILEADTESITAMKRSTAYIMTQMLKEVVSSGTGSGASVSGVNYTAGKTGTTSDNNDRWFAGYTPYYAAAIWYGYDNPKEIVVGGNPCIPVFRSIMNTIHDELNDTSRKLERPSDVVSVSYCTYSGMRAASDCPETDYFYFSEDNIPKYCGSRHGGYVPPQDEDEGKEEPDNTDEESNTSSEGIIHEPNTSTGGAEPGGAMPSAPMTGSELEE